MKLTEYKDPKKEVSKYLQKVTKLYGYATPDAGTALDLVNHIIKTFPYISASQIEFAFEYCASGKSAIDLNSYGKTLTIPVLNKVIRAYRSYRNQLIKKQNKIPSKEEIRIANINARLATLSELETVSVLKHQHYNIIDQFIYKFTREEKRNAYAHALLSEYRRRQKEDKELRRERKTLKGTRPDLRAVAKVQAKIDLAKAYIEKDIINYPAIEELIKAEKPIS